MSRRLGLTLLVVLVSALPVLADDCMDCVQKQTETRNAQGDIMYTSEALCCDAPCAGDWEMRDEDVGWGCAIMNVNNSLVVGTICNSSNADKGCPDNPPGDGTLDNGGGWSDGSGGSPIVLDLGDDNYRLTSLAGGVRFDLRNEGQAVPMAWTRLGVENAFLALDRNGNGRIDNGAELFGNYTPLRSGQPAQHGFEALGELDDDGDGAISANDGAWSTLLLWTDRNHDGASTPDELQPIAGSAVTALGLDWKVIGRKDQWGNRYRYQARFSYRGKQRAYYDVFFRMGQ